MQQEDELATNEEKKIPPRNWTFHQSALKKKNTQRLYQGNNIATTDVFSEIKKTARR
jgi:hypothetical protein